MLPAFVLASLLFAPQSSPVRQAHVEGEQAAGVVELARAFEAANPGYRLRTIAGCTELASSDVARVAFVQAGAGQVSVESASSDFALGDAVLLRPSQSARFDPPCALVVFDSPLAFPAELPWIIRPDWDPKITDTPGGCATENGAYRRILLTWESRVGPYVYRGLNAHRVRISDSFTHYHPRANGFDEFYLVQHASPGAKLWVGENLDALLDPETLSADSALRLLRPIEVRAGDLVYLPRGVAHRGVGGILAQIISVPGFVPGSEIALDDAIVKINERFSIELPFHQRRPQVEITPGVDAIAITIGGKPFTTYRFGAGEPCFFPVLTSAGTRATRSFPLEELEGEARDHPHHRSVWFAHGALNGQDFWSEGAALVKQTALVSHSSGEGRGAFEVANDWLGAEGSLVCRDMRRFEAFALDDAWGIDIDITLSATEKPLVFGDTKEGTLAVRLAAGLAVSEGGSLLDSEGRRDDAVWGKRSRWVLASGTSSKARVGVALFDHPANPRHPTTWHARDYGLVAANPFGLSDFEGAPKGSGELSVKANTEIRLRWRLLLFAATPDAARLDRIFADYSTEQAR